MHTTSQDATKVGFNTLAKSKYDEITQSMPYKQVGEYASQQMHHHMLNV